MKSNALNSICTFVSEKRKIQNLTLDNYISTENMLQNKGGITKSSGLPTTAQTQAFETGDVLVSNIRPYFKKIWLANECGGCSNDVLVFRANKNISSEFLYYVLSDDEFFDYATKTAKGTKMPRGDKKAIMLFEVPNIDIETQKQIAKILSSIDDKIELNNKINDNLEQQAQAIYYDMFADVETNGTLGDLIETTSGGTPSRKNDEFYKSGSISWVKSKELNSSFLTNTEEFITQEALCKSSAKLLPKHSVLIAMYGATVGEYCIISSEMTCNQAICALKPSKDYPHTYLYMFVKQNKEIIVNLAVGSAQQNISQILIKQLSIHSDTDVISKFHNLVFPFFNKIENNIIENQKLAQLRDTLLPRLMSGEIDVSQVEI